MDFCPELKTSSELEKEILKYKSSEELLRSGGLPIEILDRLAFGFSSEDIKELMPGELKIKWKDDLENVKWEISKSGKSPILWAKEISLKNPIDVSFKHGKFWIEDGHHRYMAAKILKKPLKVNLEMKSNPIIALAPKLGYDEFHRCIFKQVMEKNQQSNLEEIKKLIRGIINEIDFIDSNNYQGDELTFKDYKLRHPNSNTLIFVDVDKILKRHAEDDPEFEITNKKNQIGNRVAKAKNYINDYINDDRWINPKTGERSEKHYDKMTFEPSVASFYNGRLGFEDGRHRIMAAKELGLKKISLEIPKNQINIFKEFE